MIKLYLSSFLQKKGRTALVAISIAIGVFSVLIISIISTNGVAIVNRELDSLGISGLSISSESEEASERLSNRDLQLLKQQDYIVNATPIITSEGFLKFDEPNTVMVCGIDENARSIFSIETLKGRRVTRTDILRQDNVCLLDKDTAHELFATENVIGQYLDIYISGTMDQYKIVGIVKESSNILQSSIGDMLPTIIYVPYTTLQQKLGTSCVNQIAVNVSGTLNDEQYTKNIVSVLTKNRINTETLKVNDLNKQRESLNGILSTVTVAMQLIGGISLLVSGLGIMTIMLVAVSEKTREIGIKKSIGAKKKDIVLEFLLGSAVISVIGSAIGIVLTAIIVWIGSAYLRIQILINPFNLIGMIIISILCGIAFGLYPAIKAANLKPIDALRNE